MKTKILYQEKYKSGTMVKDHLLPGPFPPLAKSAMVTAIEVKSAGRCEMNGTVMEFVDLRVFSIPARRDYEI